MRIEAYNQITSLYKTNQTMKTQNSQNVKARDQVYISQSGRDYQVAKQAVSDSPDIREEKVSQLKASIQSGNYSVGASDFASKLLEKFNAGV